MYARRVVVLGLAVGLALCTAAQAGVIDVRVDFSNRSSAPAATDRTGVTGTWNTVIAEGSATSAIDYLTGLTDTTVNGTVQYQLGHTGSGSLSNDSGGNWNAANDGPAWLDASKNAADDAMRGSNAVGFKLIFSGLDPNQRYNVEVVSSYKTSGYVDGNGLAYKAVGNTTVSYTWKPYANGYVAGNWLSWHQFQPAADGTITISSQGGVGSTSGVINAARLSYLPPTITTASPLPGGTVGTAYSQTLAATGGTTPYTWSISSGSLPDGLSLSSGGVISGTPATAGTSTFTVQVTGNDQAYSTQDFSVTVDSPVSIIDVRMDFSNQSPAPAEGYWNTVAAEGGPTSAIDYITGGTDTTVNGTITYTLGHTGSGSLSNDSNSTGNWNTANAGPSWLDSAQNAAIDALHGTNATGFQLTFSNLDPNQLYDVEVVSSYKTAAYVDPTNGLAYKAVGDTTVSYQWKAYAYGYVAGNWLSWPQFRPAADGTITISSQGGVGNTAGIVNAARLYQVTASSTTITTISPLPFGTVGIAYNRTLEVAGGVAPYTWSLTSGSLPAGLTLSTSGVISGTPTTSGISSFSIQATDSNGVSDIKSFAMTIKQSPTITTQPQSQTVAVGQTAIFTVVATGYPAPTYQWKKNGVAMDGCTSATLTLNPVVASDAGSYMCVVSNTAGSVNSNAATLTVTAANTAPVVEAGDDQTITLPAAANLSGSATDDGLPNPPAAVTYTWSKDEGPGTVTFGNIHAASTTASFSVYGMYTLRLTASDGALSSFDRVTIAVNPSTPVSVNIEDFNNTTDAAYNAYGGNRVTGQSVLAGWEIGGRYFRFENFNGDRVMSSTQAYGGFDLGVSLAASNNEYQPVWDPGQASEALSLANVDQLQFQFVNRSVSSGTLAGDIDIYMYYYDTSAGTARTAHILVVPKGTAFAAGDTQTFTVSLGSIAIDKANDVVYGFRILGCGGSFSWSSVSAVNGAFPSPRISIVGTGMTYPTLKSAAGSAVDGDTIEITSGTYVGYQVWSQITRDNVTIRGVGLTRPVLDSNGDVINSKATLQTSADNITVENLEICNARSPYAANAACIRSEGINLTVRDCYFHDSGNGILEGNIHDSNIVLENSEFSHNGDGSGSTHNLYIGHCASLTMRYCHSHNAVVGHELKTRARANYILYNRLGNEGGNGSYECSACNGGTTYVIGNQIQQSASSQNGIIIDYGSENDIQTPNPDQHLYVINNTVVNGWNGGYWLRTQSDTIALVQNNIFQGPGSTAWWGPSTKLNNWITTDAHFVLPSAYDYHLTTRSTGALNLGGVPDPTTGIDGFSLIPDKQYSHPCNYVARPANGTIDIGAYEYAN